MRYLAIDLGERRTGLAVGDAETGLAAPLAVIAQPRGSEAFWHALRKAIDEHRPDALVIGLPLNMDDGAEGPAAKAARAFGAELAARWPLPIEFQDERLTSFAAYDRMARSGRTRRAKKQLRDALAAAELLRDYLERQRAEDAPQ